MKDEIYNILKQVQERQLSISDAQTHFLRLFNVKRSDSPKCDKCGADETKQSCMGKWEDGEEYRCDVCGNEWEFNHYA